ncbi:hypothetical protein FOXYSP1_11379 [Fusarium oxysporum f. sp. phaseoli]
MQKRNSGTGNRTLGSAELIPQLQVESAKC